MAEAHLDHPGETRWFKGHGHVPRYRPPQEWLHLDLPRRSQGDTGGH